MTRFTRISAESHIQPRVSLFHSTPYSMCMRKRAEKKAVP